MRSKRKLKLCFLVLLIFVIIFVVVNDKIASHFGLSNKNYVGLEFIGLDDNFGSSNESDDTEFNFVNTTETLTSTSSSKKENIKINDVSDKNFPANSTNQKNRTFADCLNPNKTNNRMNFSSYKIIPKNCTNYVNLTFLIKSSIYRNSARNTIRSTWGRQVFGDELDSDKIKTVRRIFVLGSDEDKENIPLLNRENEMFQDILQGSFPDTYASVTQKVFMGLKFITDFCNTKFVVVVDDDTIVSAWNLFYILPSRPVDQFYSGFMKTGVGPVREPKDRWFVSTEDYSCPVYPVYALGALFVLSYNTTRSLSSAYQNYPYLSMDDVYIGGLAEDIGIPKTHYSANHYAECSQLKGIHSSAISKKQLLLCHEAESKTDFETVWSEFCFAASEKNISKQILFYCQPILN